MKMGLYRFVIDCEEGIPCGEVHRGRNLVEGLNWSLCRCRDTKSLLHSDPDSVKLD